MLMVRGMKKVATRQQTQLHDLGDKTGKMIPRKKAEDCLDKDYFFFPFGGPVFGRAFSFLLAC